MLVVHHLENSRSQRILWFLEELGVKYEIKRYARDPKTKLAPPALKEIHPLGKSPVVTDGDETLAESGAIIETLAERYDPDGLWRPASGTPEALQCRYWMHYAEGTLMPLLVMTLIFSRVEKAPLLVRPIAKAISAQVRKSYLGPNIEANMDFLESTLADRDWLLGAEPSIADIQMSFPMEAALLRGGSGRPRCAAYLQRMRERPAYQRALEKGGPFDLLR